MKVIVLDQNFSEGADKQSSCTVVAKRAATDQDIHIMLLLHHGEKFKIQFRQSIVQNEDAFFQRNLLNGFRFGFEQKLKCARVIEPHSISGPYRLHAELLIMPEDNFYGIGSPSSDDATVDPVDIAGVILLILKKAVKNTDVTLAIDEVCCIGSD